MIGESNVLLLPSFVIEIRIRLVVPILAVLPDRVLFIS